MRSSMTQLKKRVVVLFLSVFMGASFAESYIVATDTLNVRSSASLDAEVTGQMRAGTEVLVFTSAEIIEKDGLKWARVAAKETAYPAGWAVIDHLLPVSEFKPFKPDSSKAVVYPLQETDHVIIVNQDGSYKEVYGAGNNRHQWGCDESYKQVNNTCVREGKQLYIAKDQVISLENQSELARNVSFSVNKEGSLCSLKQKLFQSETNDFETCSDSEQAKTYLERYKKLLNH